MLRSFTIVSTDVRHRCHCIGYCDQPPIRGSGHGSLLGYWQACRGEDCWSVDAESRCRNVGRHVSVQADALPSIPCGHCLGGYLLGSPVGR